MWSNATFAPFPWVRYASPVMVKLPHSPKRCVQHCSRLIALMQRRDTGKEICAVPLRFAACSASPLLNNGVSALCRSFEWEAA